MDLKQRIINNNKLLGIETVFYNEESDVLGYKEDRTIFLNENSGNLEKLNMHEVLHFYENTETFKEVKQVILKKIDREELMRLRNEYYLTYKDLYNNDLDRDTLDNEIVIDIITKNVKTKFNIKDYFDYPFIKIVSGEMVDYNKERKYLSLNISSQLNQSYSKLSKWEKLFVVNYYDNRNKVIPKDKETKYDNIRKDISIALQKLYDLALNKNNFIIELENNPYLEREFESEVKALEVQRGKYYADRARENKERLMKEMADRFSESLYEQYNHLVFVLKEANYEDAFKYLMLKETLEKEYKKDIKEGEPITIIKKRELNMSISDHMNLEPKVLDIIYDNIDDYHNFGEIYFAALNVFNNVVAEKNCIKIDGVDTFNKGKWIKFAGKQTNEKEYINNVKALSSLVKDTPWCTKTLAAHQLDGGDFYVFVDYDNNPHLAVRMAGSRIGEVRGILKKQIIEKEYRDVMIEFLTKNKDIEGGTTWLDKQYKMEKVDKYIDELANDKIQTNEQREEIVTFAFHHGSDIYNFHDEYNSNELKEEIKKHPHMIEYIKHRENNNRELQEFLNKYEDEKISKKYIKMMEENMLIAVEDLDEFIEFMFSHSNTSRDLLEKALFEYPDIVDYIKYKNTNNSKEYIEHMELYEKLINARNYNQLRESLDEVMLKMPDRWRIDFSNGGWFSNAFVEKIREVLKSDKILDLITKHYNLEKEDIMYIDNRMHGVDIEGKCIIGNVSFMGNRLKNIKGIIAGSVEVNGHYENPDFSNLNICDGDLIIEDASNVDMSSVESCKGKIMFTNSKFLKVKLPKEMNELVIIGCKDSTIDGVEKVNVLDIKNARFFSTEDLKNINNLYTSHSGFVDLSSVETIDGDVIIDNTVKAKLTNAIKIGGKLDANRSEILLGQVRTINDSISLNQVHIDTSNLVKVNGDMRVRGIYGMDFSSLEEVEGEIFASHPDSLNLKSSTRSKCRVKQIKKNTNR